MKKAVLSAVFVVLALATSSSQQMQAADARETHVGLPQDWSFRHLLHPGPVVGAPVNGQFRDPRVIYGQLQQQHNFEGREFLKKHNLSPKTASGNIHRDWSFTLGPGGGIADGMSPAKYSFDINAIPSCSNDFVIYTVAGVGNSTTPNIVGFTNLYSGSSASLLILPAATAGATESGNTVTIKSAPHGLVVGQQVTISGVPVAGYNGTFTVTSVPTVATFTYIDPISGLATSGGGSVLPLGQCGGSPTVKWAYNATTNGGAMKTSPVLSLSGTKVAFVEGSATGSRFHVLTLDSAGAGTFDTALNTYTAATPATMTNISLGTADVTLSSAWIDYGTDSAYVGDDNGTVYHITCVFSGCATALDWSFSLGAGKILTGPVWDQTSQAIFVGASDGKLYRLTGCVAGNTPVCSGSVNIAVGDGTTTGFGIDAGVLVGGINDPPLLDSTFQVVYASSANGSGGQLVETGTGVGTAKPFSPALATISNGSSLYVVHSPTFSDAYYSNVSGSTLAPTGTILGCAANNSKALFLYSSPFSNANAATPLSPSNPPIVGTSGQSNPPGNANAGCSPVTEFNNGSDRIFFSQPLSISNKCGTGSTGFTGGCIFENALNAGSPGTTYLGFMVTGGTSAITIDNVSTSSQASSIYFGDLGTNTCSNAGTSSTGHCAVKLTQSSLQ